MIYQIDTVRYMAGTKLVTLGYNNSQEYLEGKVNEDDVEKGRSIIRLLKALEWNAYLTSEEIENILYCLVEIAEINAFPTVSPISPVQKPDILVGIPGPAGAQGPQGEPGKDYVDVASNPAYDNMDVQETDVGGVKTFLIGYDPYVASLAGMSIDNGTVREIGSSENVNFTASIADGRDAIVSQTITAPITPTWTTDPQSFVDSAVVITSRTTRAYTARVDDGTTVDTDTKNVDFVYPLFYGSSTSILTGAQIYSQLNKSVALIGNRNVAYSFTDEYAYFAFPEDYNDSSIQILDGSGLDVTSEFTSSIIAVTSGTTHAGGGGTDWTKNYKVYRTAVKTDIDETYQFLNITE